MSKSVTEAVTPELVEEAASKLDTDMILRLIDLIFIDKEDIPS